MTKKQVTKRILDEKVFAVLRLQQTDRIEEVVAAIVAGGISTIEITLNSTNGLECLHRVSREFSDCLIGAGTVIGYDASVNAIERGAKFLVSPVTDLDMLAVGTQVGVTTIAGALTPTEAWQASLAGADFVKLFPLTGLGASYIRAVRGPLNEIPFIATNGVTPDNLTEYFEAGAVAVGLGSALVTDSDILTGDLSQITARAKRAVESAKSFRKSGATVKG